MFYIELNWRGMHSIKSKKNKLSSSKFLKDKIGRAFGTIKSASLPRSTEQKAILTKILSLFLLRYIQRAILLKKTPKDSSQSQILHASLKAQHTNLVLVQQILKLNVKKVRKKSKRSLRIYQRRKFNFQHVLNQPPQKAKTIYIALDSLSDQTQYRVKHK